MSFPDSPCGSSYGVERQKRWSGGKLSENKNEYIRNPDLAFEELDVMQDGFDARIAEI